MPERHAGHERRVAEARERMVARDLVARGLRDARVLDAMRRVPREAFVPPGLAARAYDDGPLPIGRGQTISQPYVVAWMAEAARIPEGGRVLDVGTGSGYAAAVLSMLAGEVLSVERHPPLAAEAGARLARLGLRNVRIRVGDGREGWPEEAPFDAILCAAAAEEIPEAWRRQVAPGGRIVAPIGPEGGPQELVALARAADGEWRAEPLGPVAFVPLLGGTAPG